MTRVVYPPFGSGSLANPTASVGLTAVNGTALTAMRSDGAPALDQGAAYVFSGLGNTTLALGSILKVPNGAVNAPSISFTNAAGVGFSLVNSTLNFSTGGVFGGELDATGVFVKSTGQIAFLNGITSAAPQDTILTRGGAPAALQLGAANAASPVAQTLQAQGSRAGTDSNVGGANATVQSGLGTGTGTRSTLTLKSPVVVASGTGAQTQTTGLVIDGGTAVSTGYTVATLPATPLTGARAHVTDALAPTFLATIVGGGAITTPVFYNGANWVGG